MWINPLFKTDALGAVRDLIASQSLATVVAADPLRATHVPLLLEETADTVTLIGHVPRADPVSKAIEARERVLCIFHGSRAYVSPSWYETLGLPTYNFEVAHLVGDATPLMTEELRAHLLDLVGIEEGRKSPATQAWTVSDEADQRIDRLLPAILGFRIAVDRAQAKAKLGQNRTVGDCRGTAEALHQSERAEHRDVAARMDAQLKVRVSESG